LYDPDGSWPALAAWSDRPVTKISVLGDAEPVLSAIRLGWGMAEARGRNRPDAPPGEAAQLPADSGRALPLRIERTQTELRIEAQALVAGLAKQLHVDTAADGTSFGAAFDENARLLYHARATKAARALRKAADVLAQAAAGKTDPATARASAQSTLTAGVTTQEAIMDRRRQAVTAAQEAVTAARQREADVAGHPANAAAAPRAITAAAAALQLEQTASTDEAAGAQALALALDALNGKDPDVAMRDADTVIGQQQQHIDETAEAPWNDLAELIWRFDAHIQDTLAVASETQAIGYQLGRGLAETYWALDPDQPAGGATSWGFLLGSARCGELSRLAGRLGAYMNEYTAPAIAGSIDVWKAVADDEEWRKDAANPALYNQIRRWYELVILGQDPTTLIKPGDILLDYRTIRRTLRWFAPSLLLLLLGMAALGALIFYLSVGGSTSLKTVFASLATVGLTAAGVTGKLKNSEQAMLKRLRQNAYTDLVAYAVQTAPPPADHKKLKTALAQRQLTPATPNQPAVAD
jgi:hypothetical protein